MSAHPLSLVLAVWATLLGLLAAGYCRPLPPRPRAAPLRREVGALSVAFLIMGAAYWWRVAAPWSGLAVWACWAAQLGLGVVAAWGLAGLTRLNR